MRSSSDTMDAEVRPHDSSATTSSVSEAASTSSSSPQTTSTPPPPQAQLYASISRYPFADDPEYQSGLASILGHPSTPATQSEITSKQDLVLQAQCFYFSRKFNTPPINPAAYKTWLSTQQQQQQQQPNTDRPIEKSTSSQQQQPPPPPQPTTPQAEEPPPYPTYFAAIVDLITNNKPIPGIQEIPTTILDLGSSKQDKATRRKKPWETTTTTTSVAESDTPQSNHTDDSTTTTTSGKTDPPLTATTDSVLESKSQSTSESSIEKAKSTGQGVVKILQPNAIPDSGLVAKD